MAITANKFRGVRAVTCHDDVTAETSRRHNNANVMCLSADMLGERLLNRIVEIWIRTEFEGGRHQRRLDQISEIEVQQGTSPEGGSCCG
jgi:ribose 5-phosphate isomerase B